MKKIVFITATRAEWGKLEPLISVCIKSNLFEVFIFTTGMHLLATYGGSVNEISKKYPKNYFPFYNQHDSYSMDETLSKTIDGFGMYVKDIKPDAIVAHGDRIEAMAAMLVAGTNNILSIHVEGGEVSGCLDDSLRHSISKMSNIHMVANKVAKKRLIQMGENKNNIFAIGSPDIDVMLSKNLPSLEKVKKYYGLIAPSSLDKDYFKRYAILMFHPVTTEQHLIKEQIKNICDAVDELIKRDHNIQWVIIQPNNDTGTNIIMDEYFERSKKGSWAMNVKMFPNLKFEYFLTLLKNAKFIIGNSSAGIREAGYYNVPCVNIGSRQDGRSNDEHIINCKPIYGNIVNAIDEAMELKLKKKKQNSFGTGNSAKQFLAILKQDKIWKTNIQKKFIDLNDF